MGVIKILFHTIRPHGLAIMNRSGYLLHLSSLILIITIFPVATKLRWETGAAWPNLVAQVRVAGVFSPSVIARS
jgi:hypothetical protein